MRKSDFLRSIVEKDLSDGRYKEVVTRFPPEPNGYPHIGHAKAITLNFGIAKDFGGKCHLRMDDTNPTTEDEEYAKAIEDAVRWLGFEWNGEVRHTSDYFEKLYNYAVVLIKKGKAYVDSLDEETMRLYRGTVTEAGKRSKYANRSIDENLELFERMKNGEFRDGEHVLRAKIDMSSPNMQLRDPLLYRIRHAHHIRTDNKWSIYPMYDFAHCLSDYIEGITHSFCTLEFENNRAIYDWVLDTLELEPPRPYQYEFARLNMNYTVMSKRKLKALVDDGFVSGWDDPRMPTIAGYRRRGYTSESIVNFCNSIGVSKANSIVDVAQLEYAIRDDLNMKVPRVMCVLDPIKVMIENYEGSEELEASYYPHDVPKEGTRKLPFSKEIYIEREDFEENPPKGYYRLTPTQPVRLRHAYIIRFKEAIRDENGKIVELRVEYYPDSKSGNDTSGLKVKSAIHWVDVATAKRVELRLYDRLFSVETPQGVEDINPNSLEIIKGAFVEEAVIKDRVDERFQFERQGYFYFDSIDSSDEDIVFNKIVSLKDSWSKKQKSPKATPKRRDINSTKSRNSKDGELAPLNDKEQLLFDRYTTEFKLSKAVANNLARDYKLRSFYDEALKEFNSPTTLANLVINELGRVVKNQSLDTLKISPKTMAELAKMVDDETISNKIAKDIFELMLKSGESPNKIAKERGLKQISNPQEIIPIVKDIIDKNPENVAKYRAGNQKLFGFFVGQVLKATNGKANPKIVNSLVKEML